MTHHPIRVVLEEGEVALVCRRAAIRIPRDGPNWQATKTHAPIRHIDRQSARAHVDEPQQSLPYDRNDEGVPPAPDRDVAEGLRYGSVLGLHPFRLQRCDEGVDNFKKGVWRFYPPGLLG